MLTKQHLSTKARSLRSEKRAAKFMGLKLQPGSGCGPYYNRKGDGKNAQWLLEDKTTAQAGYRLTVDTWHKLSDSAWRQRRCPCLRLEFQQGPTLYVVDELTMEKLKKGELQ